MLRLWPDRKEKKEKNTPFGVILMRSQVLYRAAQGFGLPAVHAIHRTRYLTVKIHK